LSGSGGNIAVLSGPDGKILVDTGVVASREKIQSALAALGPAPVKTAINTHFHFDHTDGNSWLRSEGVEVIAHEKTRMRLQQTNRVEPLGHTFKAVPPEALPTAVFRTQHTLFVANAQIELSYCGPAHTDTDIAVRFVDADVLHLGDTYFNNHYPLIDYSGGGSIGGLIEATERHLSWCSDRTLVIPGHGEVGSRESLARYYRMLVTCRDRIRFAKQRGLSLTEVISERPTENYDAEFGGFLIKPEAFVGLVYAGV
jgi:glyoxylase-like metal-dependent hydrolase (beta-lactamase superfamily II)